ncbi:MAG: endolytic transglycosylase MltG [Solirubrobacteraceae bacterium]
MPAPPQPAPPQPAPPQPAPPQPAPAPVPVAPEPEPEPEAVLPPEPRPAPPRPGPPSPRAKAIPPRAAPALPRRRLPKSTRRPLPPTAPGGSRVGRRVVAGLVLLLVGVVVFLGLRTFQPFQDDPSGLVRVTVPEGSSVGQIGDLLAERGVIASGTFFELNASVTGRRGGLRPGEYTLQNGMSYGTVLDALSRGPKAKVIKTFKLTLPEGFSISEQAPRVKEGGVPGDYVAAAAAEPAVDRARELGLPADQDSTEGFLFPATYDLVEGADATRLVKQQLSAFADNFGSLDLRRAKKKNLTPYDVLVIASMVEREAQLDRERPLVAGVIYNRLSQGMPLGIDATIRYDYDNWDRPLLQSQLDTPSPYNTRLNPDLPPTPIGNPGLASMEAAANPADTDFLFYVVKPGTCGEHAFSATDAEFQADVAEYNSAREAAGGNSPTTC